MKSSDPALRRAWRMAAIYRCCINAAKTRDWALEKVREVFPDGSRDHVVDLWFTDMLRLQERHRAMLAEREAMREPEELWLQAA